MYVISKQLVADAFGVYYSGYVEDCKRQVTKKLTKDLLFKHDIKPPYTNIDQWNVKKCKLPINVKYHVVISMIY